MLSSLVLLGVLGGLVNSFYFEVVDPGSVRVAPGGRVTLKVQTDGHYEWCKFFRPGGQFCDFEWKRSQGNITMQDCQLEDKVEFHGNYDDKQCGITFLAGEGDSGVWSVEVEEYYWGSSRGAGKLLTANFTVQVAKPTPEPTEPAATSAGTVIMKTTPSMIVTTTTTTTTKSATLSTIHTTKSTTQSTATTVPSTPASETEKNAEEAVKNLDDGGDDSNPPEAVPRVDKTEKAGSSSSGIVAGIVVFLLVVIVTASGVMYYRKRKNSNTASVLYDNEGQEGMVGDKGPAVTIAGGRETSNLHEYYPPSLPYSKTDSDS